MLLDGELFVHEFGDLVEAWLAQVDPTDHLKLLMWCFSERYERSVDDLGAIGAPLLDCSHHLMIMLLQTVQLLNLLRCNRRMGQRTHHPELIMIVLADKGRLLRNATIAQLVRRRWQQTVLMFLLLVCSSSSSLLLRRLRGD